MIAPGPDADALSMTSILAEKRVSDQNSRSANWRVLVGRDGQIDNPFCWFDPSPEVIRLVVIMNDRFHLSLRNVNDLLFERGIGIFHEAVRRWENRFARSPGDRPLA